MFLLDNTSWYLGTIHHSTTRLTFPSPLIFFQVSRPLATSSLARSLRDLIEARFARFACFTRKTQGKLRSIEEMDLEQEYNNNNFPLITEEHPKLNQIDKEKCEGLLTEKEGLEAVKSMELGKSPGTDGLPTEFYKVFWKDISPILISSLNRSYQKGKLAITQRRGIISLIPKKDKALNELKNWRPITLLNCDYKIASKAIASRLKSVLSDLIEYDQSGFLKGRSIAENICLINNVISYTLLFVDFEKPYDTIEWSFVRKALEQFGFGSSFINWISLFYTDIQSCIINNGWSGGFLRAG